MPNDHLLPLGVAFLLAEGIVFGILNEMSGRTENEWRGMAGDLWKSFLQNMAELPAKDDHWLAKISLVATVLLSVVPWGWAMLAQHPCFAWACWGMALLSGAYSFWSLTPIYRGVRIAVIVLGILVFCSYARKSLYWNTELNFFFINPGVSLGSGTWAFKVIGQDSAHKPLMNVQMIFDDVMMGRAAANEPDMAKRIKLIQSQEFQKTYPEVNGAFSDLIVWRPLGTDNQEYNIRASYRIGDNLFWDSEEIRIVGIGKDKWTFSVTVRNQSNKTLLHCISKYFPHDDRWVDGPPCGGHYPPILRSLCSRCFDSQFEFDANK